MSTNEYQRVVCFALPPTSIAGFALMVCKLQSIFTNTPHVRIRYYVCQIIYVFDCSDPGYYFRFVGLLVQYIIIVVDLFHNGICTCVLFISRAKRV